MISLKSEITKKLLNYFFINPGESLYLNELVRKLNLDKRNLAKKLNEMEGEGLLKSHTRGNLRIYSLDTSYPFYKEYRQLILKTAGVQVRLKQALKHIAGIAKVYIYGSYAKGKMGGHSDIDVLIVGKHSMAGAQKKINALQREIDREINVVHMSPRDFAKRLAKRDPFLSGVMKERHIQVI
jgi:predicted nucleotidyltransferase